MSQEIEIFIVEESLSQAEQLKHILEQHGHKVSVEHKAQPALTAMRARPPQIVISAIMLPLMDGYELCREIKADKQLKDIPVILLTSLSETTDIIRGMECLPTEILLTVEPLRAYGERPDGALASVYAYAPPGAEDSQFNSFVELMCGAKVF